MAAVAAARPRALIAARDAELRSGLRRAIEPVADCCEAGGAADALDVLERESPDVCLLGSDGAGALRLTELIHQARPTTRIVLLTKTVDEGDFLRAVRAGACGYLLETVARERLPDIVTGVLRGEVAVPRALVGRLLHECRNPGSRQVQRSDLRSVDLTRREAEVLDLTRACATTRAIAQRLGISEVTVRRHRASLLAKLHVRTVGELGAALDGSSVDGAQPPAALLHLPTTS